MNPKLSMPILASILILGAFTVGFSFNDAEAKSNKVSICHKPGTSAENTISVSENAIPAHVGHGDFIGTCEDGPDCENYPDQDVCPKVNTPPTIGSVTLTQNVFGLVSDVSGGFAQIQFAVECAANDVIDADGDPVTLTFEWLREDGTLITTGSTLPAFSSVGGSPVMVTCKVIPFDGTEFGASASQTVTMFIGAGGGGGF